MLHQIHPNRIRQILFLLFIGILGFVIAKEMYYFLNAFLGAITLYVILRSSLFHLIIKKKWKRWIAAFVLILSTIILLVIPFAWLSTVIINRMSPYVQNPDTIKSYFESIHQYLLVNYKIEIFSADNIQSANTFVVNFAKNAIGGTMNGIGTFFFMYLILYFMLTQCLEMELWFKKSLPFKQKNVTNIITELKNMIFSNAIGIPLVAIIQGFVGMLGYWIFGIQEFVLMGVFTAISSVIPLVGTMIVFIPLMLLQLSIGNIYQGIGVGLWGLLIIGSMDNVARLFLQKKLADVHPLITLFGAFIGLNMFGFLGIIFGPLILSIFLLLVRIYIDEFGIADADQLDKNKL